MERSSNGKPVTRFGGRRIHARRQRPRHPLPARVVSRRGDRLCLTGAAQRLRRSATTSWSAVAREKASCPLGSIAIQAMPSVVV